MRSIVRRLSQIPDEPSLCGTRRPLLGREEGSPASINFLAIHGSAGHYHKLSTEFYYVLEGRGKLHLDDEIVELEPHTLVMIPPGVRHHAEGDIKTLICGYILFPVTAVFLGA